MKCKGRAAWVGLRILAVSLAGMVVVLAAAYFAFSTGDRLAVVMAGLTVLWAAFGGFVINFFRDPDPKVPGQPGLYVSPAYGTVDAIGESEEPDVMGGRCRRISIFLSVFDVHIQYAPVAGKVTSLRRQAGQFLNAMNPESALRNENVLVGFESADQPGERVGVRLIAGLIARRIVPWVQPGDTPLRGERISLIQFGSRVDVYLPLGSVVKAELGQKVRGGETVLAMRG